MTLAEYLKRHDLDAAGFGRKVGMSKSYIARLVRGERVPRPDTMARISRETRGLVTANDFYEQPLKRKAA